MAGFLQLWFFLASFIPWLLIDRLGRRPLLSMITIMACVVAIQAALVYQVLYWTVIAYSAGIDGAVMLFIFEGAFTIGSMPRFWCTDRRSYSWGLGKRGAPSQQPVIGFATWVFYGYAAGDKLYKVEDWHHLYRFECKQTSQNLEVFRG